MSQHYFFQIKKCGIIDCNICKPLRSDQFDFSIYEIHKSILGLTHKWTSWSYTLNLTDLIDKFKDKDKEHIITDDYNDSSLLMLNKDFINSTSIINDKCRLLETINEKDIYEILPLVIFFCDCCCICLYLLL